MSARKNYGSRPSFGVLTLALAVALACTRPPASPDSSGNSQNLPFSSESHPSTSLTNPLIPSAMHISEGSFLTVRLTKPLSSATARAGDSFEGMLDEPVVADRQTLLPAGAKVSGRVLDAKPSAGPHNPGYLRITLVSVNALGKTVLIDTNSIFTKGSLHDHTPADRPSPSGASGPSEVLFTPDRRLTFRLAQAVDLQ